MQREVSEGMPIIRGGSKGLSVESISDDAYCCPECGSANWEYLTETKLQCLDCGNEWIEDNPCFDCSGPCAGCLKPKERNTVEC